MSLLARLCVVLSLGMLASCATSIDGARYRSDCPAFDLFDFFDGQTRAWGIVQNRSGEVVQRFTVDISGRVTDSVLRLDETFDYQLGDGVTERVWTIRKRADGSYRGGASDISGPAMGEDYGNAFRWAYEMDLPVDDTTYRVKFEDWIWLLDEHTLVNRSYIQKYGLDVAEVTIFMQRSERVTPD